MISKLNALKDKELSNGSKKIKSRKIDIVKSYSILHYEFSFVNFFMCFIYY